MKPETKEASLKFKFCFILPLLGILSGLGTCSSRQEAGDLRESFLNPPDENRPWVYWFWNGDIDSAGIRFQLAKMRDSQTVSTIVILGWEGLMTEYLSGEWFDLVKYACDEADELGLKICLYDEWCWPSGHAGGLVLKNRPELRSKCLTESIQEFQGPGQFSEALDEKPVAVLAVPVINGKSEFEQAIDLSACYHDGRIEWPTPQGAWRIFIYKMQPGIFRPVFADNYYVDLLDPRVAQEFMRITYEPYFRKMPHYFGSVIGAIMTDEPGVYQNLKPWGINPGAAAWTPQFPAEFRKRKGYDLVPNLSALWHDLGKESVHVRNDYYDVVAGLLQDSYFKPLQEWAQEHGIQLIIQPAHEETLKYSTIMQGDYFGAMQSSHIKSADAVYNWDKRALTPKIAASTARCAGTQKLYCEVFGAYGWSITPETMKAVTDWLHVHGVNHLMMSSFYYDFQGDWRLEIPPSLFYRTNYWPFLRNFTNYSARLSVILAGGQNVANIAVLYPDRTARAALSLQDETAVDSLDRNFQGLCEQLLARQWDYDILNEAALQTKTKIRRVNGKTIVRLAAGEVETDYDLLILPWVTVIEKETLAKLRAWRKRGGRLLFIGEKPRWDNRGESLGDEFEYTFLLSETGRELTDWLAGEMQPDVQLREENPAVNYIHKRKAGLDIYFISNHDSLPVENTISFTVGGTPQAWNPEDGCIRPVFEYSRENGQTVMPLRLEPFGSQLIVFDPSADMVPRVVATNMKIRDLKNTASRIRTTAEAQSGGENFVELDWRGRRYSQTFQATIDTVALADAWRFEPGDGSFESEYRKSGSWTDTHSHFSGIGIYTQSFSVDSAWLQDDRRVYLDPGRIEHSLELRVNGEVVGQRCWKPLYMEISDYLREGENRLELRIANSMANAREGRSEPSGLLGEVKLIVRPVVKFE